VTLAARLRIWWTILRISFEERLVYPGDFALGTLMRFLPIVTQTIFQPLFHFERALSLMLLRQMGHDVAARLAP